MPRLCARDAAPAPRTLTVRCLLAGFAVVAAALCGCNQKDPAPSPYNSHQPVAAVAVL